MEKMQLHITNLEEYNNLLRQAGHPPVTIISETIGCNGAGVTTTLTGVDSNEP